jgi:hypothetical protein
MNFRTSCVSILFVMLTFVVNAQDYTFRVLVNKGKNEIKNGDSWTPLKVGSSLRSLDEVKVPENAYLGLVHANGKPLEVKQSGKYKVVDLAARVSGGASVLNKYTDFILSSKTSAANSLTATGAVHRGTASIKIYLPPSEQSIVYNDNIIVQWDKDAGDAPYTVTFNSLYGDQLLKTETSDNFLPINLSSDAFKKEDNIIVRVSSKSSRKQSEDYTLKRLPVADKEKIRMSLNEFASDVQEQNALNKLIMASFYEQNKLLIDASTAYQEAIRLEPTVEMYRDDYDAFLFRNLMKAPPKDK